MKNLFESSAEPLNRQLIIAFISSLC